MIDPGIQVGGGEREVIKPEIVDLYDPEIRARLLVRPDEVPILKDKVYSQNDSGQTQKKGEITKPIDANSKVAGGPDGRQPHCEAYYRSAHTKLMYILLLPNI